MKYIDMRPSPVDDEENPYLDLLADIATAAGWVVGFLFMMFVLGFVWGHLL